MATNATTSEKTADQTATGGDGNFCSAVWTRITDHAKWPRRWWWPATAEPETEDGAGTYQELHDEASKTIRRVMLTIVGYSFFCLLTLSTPDSLLVENNNKIKVPFAQIEVEFIDFLIVGPLVLLALVVYMHIFIAFWAHIPRQYVSRPLPFVFNMPGTMSRLIAACLFYWLAPMILFLFALKALPHFTGADVFYAKALFFLASVVTAAMLWMQIRCCPPENRLRLRYLVLWPTLLLFGFLSIKLAWPLGDRAAEISTAAATTLATPILAELGLAEKPPTQVASAEPEPAGSEAPLPPVAAGDTPPSTPSSRQPAESAAEPDKTSQQVVQQDRTAQALAVPSILNRGLNLAGADLIKVDFSKRDFRNADLRGAVLDGQTLNPSLTKYKDFTGANMENTSIRNAEIHWVNFFRVNLRNAVFKGSQFAWVIIQNADVRGADFTDTTLDSVVFRESDLRGVMGLSCRDFVHSGVERFRTNYRDAKLACGQPIPKPPAAAQ